jgi:hypothetical protein
MKIPVNNGRTSLAYVTDEERKLLRRRDAVKGSPNKKMSYGIPKLAPESDYLMDLEREKELRAKEDALRKAGFEKVMTAGGGKGTGGAEKYVHIGKGLSAGYVGSPSASPIKYGMGADEVRRFPSMGSALPEKKEPAPKPKPTPPSGGGGSGSSSSSSSSSSAATATPSTTYEAPSTPATPSKPTLDESQLQQPMLDEIVADGVNSELLETRLTNLINKNNPLFKAATTKTMQAMAARGLVNSSIAEEAVMSAILSVAMPIAERDANAYMNQRMQNQAYSNEFRTAQNKAYYESFLMELQGSMDMALRQLTEQSANWRAVLQARSNITTTSGMGAESAELGMAAVTPDWWTQ